MVGAKEARPLGCTFWPRAIPLLVDHRESSAGLSLILRLLMPPRSIRDGLTFSFAASHVAASLKTLPYQPARNKTRCGPSRCLPAIHDLFSLSLLRLALLLPSPSTRPSPLLSISRSLYHSTAPPPLRPYHPSQQEISSPECHPPVPTRPSPSSSFSSLSSPISLPPSRPSLLLPARARLAPSTAASSVARPRSSATSSSARRSPSSTSPPSRHLKSAM